MDQETVDDVTALVESHARLQRGLLQNLLRLLGLFWGWRGTFHDPILAKSATAETILAVSDAMDAARDAEVAFVAEYASLLGVEYDPSEVVVDPVYVRDADLHDVYGRGVDVFRWERFGRLYQWDDVDAFEHGYESVLDAVDQAEAHDAFMKSLPVPDAPTVGDVPQQEDGESDAEFDRETEAWLAAMERMERVVADDLQRAADKAHVDMLGKKNVWLGYRRVIHPELSESGTCGLCVAASTRVYSKKMLAPMHSHCKCTTIGVSSSSDIGRQINQNDADAAFSLLVEDEGGDVSALPFTRDELDSLYADAGSTAAGDLTKVSLDVDYNELGPVVAWSRERVRSRGRKFTPESLSVTRQKWLRTKEWAERQRVATLDALARLDVDNRNVRPAYEAAILNFENVALRMSAYLDTYRL